MRRDGDDSQGSTVSNGRAQHARLGGTSLWYALPASPMLQKRRACASCAADVIPLIKYISPCTSRGRRRGGAGLYKESRGGSLSLKTVCLSVCLCLFGLFLPFAPYDLGCKRDDS